MTQLSRLVDTIFRAQQALEAYRKLRQDDE